jgi:hypothetical protein
MSGNKIGNKWKDFLLKSSLPLEFEVKNQLKELGFDNKYEYPYLKENEEQILTQFSYDIDSCKEFGDHCFELMIECKFRDESTNWIFLPEDMNKSDRGIGYNDFLNTNDFFYKNEYNDYFKLLHHKILGPICSKGIEINSNGQNPKTIPQAISQLSYAIIQKMITGFERQLNFEEVTGHFIYHHIPIIVTTSNLYRLKNDVSIQEIKDSNEINAVATKESILLIEPPFSIDLKNHAIKKLSEFEAKYPKQELNKRLNKQLTSNKRNYDYHRNEILDSPRGILVIQHNTLNNNFVALSKRLEEIVKPPKESIDEIDKLFGSKIKALDSFK